MVHRVIYQPGSVPTSGYGPRILVTCDASKDLHVALCKLCKWGQWDKTLELEDGIYMSYEFGEAEYAKARVVTEYYKLIGVVTD